MLPTALAAANASAPHDTISADIEMADGEMRIGDVARTFGVTLRALRFYEDKGLIGPRREGQTRFYSRRDVARLRLILLGRKIGFPLREVKQMLDLYEPRTGNVRQMRVALDKGERQLRRLREQEAALRDAIGDLESALTTIKGKLATR